MQNPALDPLLWPRDKIVTDFLLKNSRTHTCCELTKKDIGKKVVLMGWVQSLRDHGGRRFVDLRDRYGITQIVFKPETDQKLHVMAHELRSEWCIAIIGEVEDRKDNGGSANPRLITGEIEVDVKTIEVFSKSDVPPFLIEDEIDTHEEKRLAARTLDLRRPSVQRRFILRHRVNQSVRRYFDECGFLEFETPTMVKYTPGGARNFLVPSRLSPGSFFALAESPQLFKQMLMMSGFDKYFQIVKCYRDEDLRGDRQPEFTQIDMEMSFATEETVLASAEGLMKRVFKEALETEIETPFRRMTYDEAMARYGSDKPDTRFGLEHVDITGVIRELNGAGLPLFEQTLKNKGMIKVMVLPAEHALSRTEIDKLESVVKQLGGMGLGRAKVANNGLAWTQSPFSKLVSEDSIKQINAACHAKDGDTILFQFGHSKLVHTVLSGLRLHLGKQLGLINKSKTKWDILWITDFPLFEYDEDSDVQMASHHPFTSPRIGDENKLQDDPGHCYARAYDLVINGNEIGGGSIRIHDIKIQEKVFTALGIGPKEQNEKFGFLLEAMRYGPPPHGGIALGMDRLCTLLSGGSSIRDVIAFPKSQKGTDLLTHAPSRVDNDQLKELYVLSTAQTDK